MLESAWLFVGGLGTLWLVFALASMVFFDPDSSGDVIQLFCAVLAFVCYGVFTYGSLDVEVAADSVTYSFTMPEVTFLGICMTLAAGFVVLSKPMDLVGHYRDAEPREL